MTFSLADGTYTYGEIIVRDAAGNKATLEIPDFTIDTKAPVINLKNGDYDAQQLGDNRFKVTIERGTVFNDPRARAFDEIPGGNGTLQEITDEIIISGEVDTNTVGVYYITYRVSDAAGNEATVIREVHVIDRTPPTIKEPSNSNILIDERTTFVGKFTASEEVDWSIINSGDGGAFSIDENGNLSFKEAPDYENPLSKNNNNEYEVTVKATDAANLSDSKTVTVTVTDVNDNPPIIISDEDVINININENSGPGAEVYNIEATGHGTFDYSISGTDAHLLTVDTSGSVTLNGNPDYETKNKYKFTVKVESDFGSDEKDVILNIINIDEFIKIVGIDEDASGVSQVSVPAHPDVTGFTDIVAGRKQLKIHEFTAKDQNGDVINNDNITWEIDADHPSKNLYKISDSGVLSFEYAPNPTAPNYNNKDISASIIASLKEPLATTVDVSGQKDTHTIDITIADTTYAITGVVQKRAEEDEEDEDEDGWVNTGGIIIGESDSIKITIATTTLPQRYNSLYLQDYWYQNESTNIAENYSIPTFASKPTEVTIDASGGAETRWVLDTSGNMATNNLGYDIGGNEINTTATKIKLKMLLLTQSTEGTVVAASGPIQYQE